MIAAEQPDRLVDDAHRGQEAFDLHVRPVLRPEDHGKFVAVDLDSAAYEIDADDYSAATRLLARRPGARVWLLRAGEATAYRIGRRDGAAG